jgi:hypothetical protein
LAPDFSKFSTSWIAAVEFAVSDRPRTKATSLENMIAKTPKAVQRTIPTKKNYDETLTERHGVSFFRLCHLAWGLSVH